MRDYRKDICYYIEMEKRVMDSLDTERINQVMNLLEETRERESVIYICGNGGSASTASHFVCDFNKGVSLEQDQKYNFVCLNDNVPNMMAIANDIGYDQIFRIPLENKITSQDLFIGISGSGNSRNVILAAKYAKSCGAVVVGITGYDGGELKKLADYNLHVAIDNMQIVEDIHMMFDHMMMWILSYGQGKNNIR